MNVVVCEGKKRRFFLLIILFSVYGENVQLVTSNRKNKTKTRKKNVVKKVSEEKKS